MINNAKLIIFEGPDFCGKTTQQKQIMREIKRSDILYSREPGSFLPESMYYCEEIRQMILNNNLTVEQEAKLFAEARYEHTKEMIKYMKEGFNILCDRHIVSSLAYQGYAQGLGKDKIYELNKATIDLLEENKKSIYCFKFVLSEDIWRQRKEESLKKMAADSIESKNLYDKIFEFYNNDNIFYDYTDKLNLFTHTVDANKSIQEIHKYVLNIINTLIK